VNTSDPAESVRTLAVAYWHSRCLHAVVELGVADALGDTAEPVEEIARKVGADTEALNRVLRFLAGVGIFEDQGRRYAHSPASRFLRLDHPQSVYGLARFAAAGYHWQAWGELPAALKSGRVAFESLFECNSFEYFRRHPEEGRVFDLAMTTKAQGDNAAIIASYDLSGVTRIADVGGGAGHLIRAMLTACPHLRGVLFDLPAVIARSEVEPADRLEFQGGDFFNDDLPVADLYLLMMILHDWSDEACIRLLRNLRRVVPDGARILVVEALLPTEPGPAFAKMTDVEMLVLTGGRERTETEYRALLERSGFDLRRVFPTSTQMVLLEASPWSAP
jgi:hypothetical protein